MGKKHKSHSSDSSSSSSSDSEHGHKKKAHKVKKSKATQGSSRGAFHATSKKEHDPLRPPSGYRIPLDYDTPFPDQSITGLPPFYNADNSPMFLGSALLGSSVHPCRISPTKRPACTLGYGGIERLHNGRYDLLPFDPNTMEWIPAANGEIPSGRTPIEGGYEDHGIRLYHAMALIGGTPALGKTGAHLVCKYCLGFMGC